MEQNKRLKNAQKFTRINRNRKTERIYSETKIINGGKFNIVKCAEFGVERTSRKVREKSVKRTSVPKSKSKSDIKGSFPKCAGEQPRKPKKLAEMPTNVKIENMPDNVQNLLNPTKNTKLTEKPSKYKNTNLLKNRLEIVGDVKVCCC